MMMMSLLLCMYIYTSFLLAEKVFYLKPTKTDKQKQKPRCRSYRYAENPAFNPSKCSLCSTASFPSTSPMIVRMSE